MVGDPLESLERIAREILRAVEEAKQARREASHIRQLFASHYDKLVKAMLTSDEVEMPLLLDGPGPFQLKHVEAKLGELGVPYKLVARGSATTRGGNHVEFAIYKVPRGYLHVALEHDLGGEAYIMFSRTAKPDFPAKLGLVEARLREVAQAR